MVHKHDVLDSDVHFVIDQTTREITTESKKVTLIQHDHNSERFTFDIPRYVEGHDMLQCNRVEVHYINVDKKTKESSPDVYEVNDFQESSYSEGMAAFSWLISSNATKYVGSLSFIVRFACVAEDGAVEYAWHTAIYDKIVIGNGILNTEVIANEYSDILAAWEARIEALETGFAASEYNVPTLYLTGDTANMNKDNDVPLTYRYDGHEGTCTLKWQGSSSLAYPKKNYTIKLDNPIEVVEGWGAQKKYCLKANFIDYSHARNVVSAKLWGQVVKSRAGVSENLTALPNAGAIDGFPVAIVLNGSFHGLYTFNIPKDGWMFGMGEGSAEAIVCANNHSEATAFRALAKLDESDFELEYAPEDNDGWVLDSLNALLGAVSDTDGGEYAVPLEVLKTGYNIDAQGNETPLESYVITENIYVHNGCSLRLDVVAGCVDNYMRVAEYAADGSFITRQLLDNAKGAASFELTFNEATSYVRFCTNRNDLQYYTLIETVPAGVLNPLIDEHLDWNSAIDYLIFTALLGGNDMTTKNYILSTYDGVKWFFSAYDMDSTYGLHWNGKTILGADTGTSVGIEGYASGHRLMRLVRWWKTDQLKARYKELREGVLSENNVAKVFCNFAAAIPQTLYDEDLREWPTVPSSSVSNIGQILNWYRMRVITIDAEIEAMTGVN